MTPRQLDVRGRVVLPGDADWDQARRSWNLSVDQRPAAVVEAAGVEDVQAVLRSGLRVAPPSTGHGSEGLPGPQGAGPLETSPPRGGAGDARFVRAGARAPPG